MSSYLATEREGTLPATEVVGRVKPSRCEQRGLAANLIVAGRPQQWIKNAFVLLPAAFGGAPNPLTMTRVVAVAAAFCLASSGLYLVNDVCDREADRAHVRKRMRPIASSSLSVRAALLAGAVLALVSLAIAGLVAPGAGLLLAVYMLGTLAYSLRLKHIVIVDVMVLATGFVLRVLAGAAAASVVPSEWLLLCTLFLALFLGFGKRRHELVQLGPIADAHRRVLGDYSRDPGSVPHRFDDRHALRVRPIHGARAQRRGAPLAGPDNPVCLLQHLSILAGGADAWRGGRARRAPVHG